MRNFLLGIIFTLLVLIIGAYWYTRSGRVDFAADQPPSSLEKRFAMGAVDASTESHAPSVKNPVPATEQDLAAGAQLYLNHCGGCHGVPSNPDSQFAHSFNPPVPQFFKDGADMPENQNFYIIQHGVRWSGMPAWNKTLSDDQIWQIVTFLDNVEKLPPSAQHVFDLPPPPPPTKQTKR